MMENQVTVSSYDKDIATIPDLTNDNLLASFRSGIINTASPSSVCRDLDPRHRAIVNGFWLPRVPPSYYAFAHFDLVSVLELELHGVSRRRNLSICMEGTCLSCSLMGHNPASLE